MSKLKLEINESIDILFSVIKKRKQEISINVWKMFETICSVTVEFSANYDISMWITIVWGFGYNVTNTIY